MTAEILTSFPDSPWTLTSPNLCSTRTDWPAPRANVFSKLRVTSSCGQFPEAHAGNAVSRRAAAIPPARRAPRKRSLFQFDKYSFIAFPPKCLAAFAASLDTWPAVVDEDAHWTDSFRLAREDRRWRYRARVASRGSSLATVSRDYRVPPWLPRPVCRWLSHRRLVRVPLRREPDSSEETGRRDRLAWCDA